MKKCTNCGKIINDEYGFCSGCGASSFVPADQPAAPAPVMVAPAPAPVPVKKDFTKFDLLTVLGFVASIVGFFQLALILEPIALVSALLGFLKGKRSKGLAVAGFVISVIALLIKLFETLYKNGVVPSWLVAGTID